MDLAPVVQAVEVRAARSGHGGCNPVHPEMETLNAMKRWTLCVVVALGGCTGLEGVTGPKGDDGQSGTDGTAGVSTLLILQRQEAAAGCNGGPGVVAASYLDVDGSGTVTTGDRLVSQAVVCDGANGTNGAPGEQGPAGPAGSDGASCTVQTVAADPSGPAPNGGALLTCSAPPPRWSSMVLLATRARRVSRARPRRQPRTRSSRSSTLAAMRPESSTRCSSARRRTGHPPFSDDGGGTNTRLSILIDGSFTTSDGSSCAFAVSTDTSTTPAIRTISWSGGSESWSFEP